jgi:hypothetical protein
MQKKSLAFGLLLVSLAACRSQNTADDSGQVSSAVSTASSSVSSALAQRANVHGLTFHYPAAWGDITKSEYALNSDVVSSYEFDVLAQGQRQERDRTNASLWMEFRAYDEGDNRYEEVCVSEVDLCDSIETSDMFQQKRVLEAKANVQIAGYPATYEEHYDPSGAGIIRAYEFFTPTHRVKLTANYDVGHLYTEEYNRRTADGRATSLSELVAEDLGQEYADPYNTLRRLYPAETEDMKAFFDAVNEAVVTMKFEA